jgi:peroxiredoxin
MAQLRRDYQKYKDRDAEVIVVGPEGADQFRAFWKEHDLPFIGLPNPNHSVLKLYGQQIKIFKFGRMPAQVIVNRQGLARFVHYGDSMSDIPQTKEMLEILDQLNQVNEAVID